MRTASTRRALTLALVACSALAGCAGGDDGPPTASTADEVVDGLQRRGVVFDRSHFGDHRAYFSKTGARVTVLLYESEAALQANAEADKRGGGAIDHEFACGAVFAWIELTTTHEMDRRLRELPAALLADLTHEYGPRCVRARLRP